MGKDSDFKFRYWDEYNKEMVYFELGMPRAIEDMPLDAPIMEYTGCKDINGKGIYEGDLVKHTMHVRVDTRRMRVGRRYESYGVYANKEIIGIVKKEFYCKYGNEEKVLCFIVGTNSKTSYNSYFYGEGKRNDIPNEIHENLSQQLFLDKKYEIVGNIYSNKLQG